ncbi:MAG: fumarylacetoacetate hydrolase family protein [Aliiglaciecola sp.]|uniref:fumarylacetoacetate hydrolase family protein n=1 Tax=Aliiglaciecola sp. TaxID=1872441 RepID=UPI0032999111
MSSNKFMANMVEPAVEPENINPATGLVEGTFGIGTYQVEGEAAFPGLVLPNGDVLDLSDKYVDTHAIFDDWDNALVCLKEVAAKKVGPVLSLNELIILPVLSHPNMICAASNYRQHVAEMMTFNKFNQDKRLPGEDDEAFFKRNYAEVDRRGREGTPFFFVGMHSALCGANDDVPLPLIGQQPDWELELGVIVGKGERYVRPENAEDMIAAYVMVNDIGTVDEFKRADIKFNFDWISKFQPNFKPFGPFAVPKEFVDRTKMQIRLNVNGEKRQDWPAEDMIFSPGKVLSHASERVKLMPGDLMIMGSPPGNAAMLGGLWLKEGDVMEAEITYLGRQRNNIVKEETHGRTPTYGAFKTEW